MEFLFTQKQYQEIKKASESFLNVYNTGLYEGLSDKLQNHIFWKDLEKEAMELANPNTRESAKLKYVEPEPPEYIWWYYGGIRFINKKGEVWYLDNNDGRYDDVQTAFTEKEIDESPFKKEFFIKKNKIRIL